MSDTKINDFNQMLTMSTTIANEHGIHSENILVQIVDEDGEVYDIVDVKFELATRSITLVFDHDND